MAQSSKPTYTNKQKRSALSRDNRESAPKQGSLENQSKQSLLEIARAHAIPGRSHMNKQDLIAALRSPRA